MKHLRSLLMVISLAASLLSIPASFAEQPTQDDQPLLIPAAPSINAKGYVLIDDLTGKIIAQNNADQRVAPASLTKLMSLYLVFSALESGTIHLDDKVHISTKAWQTGGSKMFIKAGDDVTIENLIQGVIVDSGNDATVALAEYVAGSETSFVDMMNIQAQRLGMTNSHFMDATGLPNKDHYTTPRDLSTLARDIINTFPDYYHFFSEKWFTFSGIKQPNRNRLLWRFEGSDGMKTGHTDAAGYCLIASAKRDDMRLIAIVMGAPSDEMRSSDSISLMTYGFRFFEDLKLFDANEVITTVKVFKAKKDSLNLGVTEPLYVTLPVGAKKFIKTNISVQPEIIAPLDKGTSLGTITVSYAGDIISQQALVALKNDPKAGLWGRMTGSIKLAIHHLFGGKKTKQDAPKPAEKK